MSLLCAPSFKLAVSWPSCLPFGAIQNRACKFRTRDNNNNDKQGKLDEENKNINNKLAVIPVTYNKKEESLNFAPAAVTHELGRLSAVVG
jgi:hypothetical protein